MAGAPMAGMSGSGVRVVGLVKFLVALNWKHAHGLLWLAYTILAVIYVVATSLGSSTRPPLPLIVALSWMAAGSMFVGSFKKRHYFRGHHDVAPADAPLWMRVLQSKERLFFCRTALWTMALQTVAAAREFPSCWVLGWTFHALSLCIAVMEVRADIVMFTGFAHANSFVCYYLWHTSAFLTVGWEPKQEDLAFYQSCTLSVAAIINSLDVFEAGLVTSKRISMELRKKYGQKWWVSFAVYQWCISGFIFGRYILAINVFAVICVQRGIKYFGFNRIARGSVDIPRPVSSRLRLRQGGQ